MKKNLNVWIALGSGIVIGGLLGVLFAPDKGKDTRKKIAKQGKKLKDELTEKVKFSRNSFKKDYVPEHAEMEELVN